MIARILKRKYKLLAPSLILLLGILIYANTLHSSFHYDDFRYIADNYYIRDVINLKSLWNFSHGRFFILLTFALNYHLHKLDLLGYHIFNLIIHLGAAILVWWLVRLIFSTPLMKGDRLLENSPWIALFTALIFLSHPLQTESVTYIWQRCTSLGGFFYLFSVCLYIKSRLLKLQNSTLFKWIVVYVLSLIFAVMSMFTKENSITLPVMIILCEFYFFRPDKFNSWKHIIPFLFLLPIVPIILSTPQPKSVNTGGCYFLTQFRVIITYIRLLFIPLNQNLNYDYPVANSLFNFPSLISFGFLVAIMISAIRVFLKYRLISFGILWFFLTLSPDSSFVPLDDVIFEHRLYLPMVGFSLFLVSFIYYFFKHKSLKAMVTVLLIVISCYSLLTYRRNSIWKDELTLWNDVVHKSPKKARPYISRGNAYHQQGNFIQAVSDYTQAIAINPNYAEAYYNRGIVYDKQGNFIQAISDYTRAIVINPNYVEAYYNRGIVYDKQGNFIQAISDYTQAIAANSSYAESFYSRGIIYVKAEAFYNRGIIYVKQGNFIQAISDYTQAIAINPNYAEAYLNRGLAYYLAKEYDKAWLDEHEVERLGYAVHPEFLNALKEASGRSN